MSDIYFISYDISNNKLRSKIEKKLKNYGSRIQYSIFQCVADTAQIAKVSNALENILNIQERLVSDGDSIIIIGSMNSEKINYIIGEAQELHQYSIF